jgi:hypothetical protein
MTGKQAKVVKARRAALEAEAPDRWYAYLDASDEHDWPLATAAHERYIAIQRALTAWFGLRQPATYAEQMAALGSKA